MLLTDGEVGNEAAVMSLVRGSASTTRFFAVGIGAGPNDHLVRGLARAGGGTAAFIFPGERIEPRVLGIFRQAIGARVSNLSIDWGGRAEQAPASPTLLLGDPMSAFARIGGASTAAPSAAPPSVVTVSAEIDGKPVRWELPVADAGSGSTPIPTLWARARIRDLEESPEAGGKGSRQQRPKGEAWKQEVISLATEFGLSSSLTSWIAVEEREEKDRQTGELVLRKVPALVTVGWHGVGSVHGARFGGVVAQSMAAPMMRKAPGRPLAASIMRETAMKNDISESFMLDAKAFFRRKTSATPPESAKPTAGSGATNTDLLMALLALQRVDGGFDLDDAMLTRLGIKTAEIAAAAAGLAGERKASLRILHTAIALAVLETRFADVRGTWFAVVRKSRTWLKQATGGQGLVARGKTIAGWAEEVSLKAVRSLKA